jgi:hypothetical protein
MALIGILFCAYNCDHSIDEVLKPWIEVKLRNRPDQFLFSFSYGQFKEYADLFGAAPIVYPAWFDRHKSNIDFFQLLPPLSEAENRNAALKPLLEAGCDLIMLVDCQDEYFTVKQIDDIFNKVRLERFVSWFSIQYRNFVFTDQEYLAAPFTPPRIFRVNTNGYKLLNLFYDNDFSYGMNCFEFNKNCEKIVSYKDLPNKLIRNEPVIHLSWMSNQVGKSKVEYQVARGWSCSYKWNEIENKLEFNEDYYQKLGQKVPATMKISIDSNPENK